VAGDQLHELDASYIFGAKNIGPMKKQKVAIVHYWLVGMRGGEKVVEALCELYPEADIFTLVADESKISSAIKKHKIQTSFLQKMFGVRFYKHMLFLMPFALESFDLRSYDLVISSEAGPAKGVVTDPDSLHICYCHSPMRYVWDLYPQYRSASGLLARVMMSVMSPFIRQWDVTTATRVDHFVANSRFVASRINKYYRRSATVIHPPVNTDRFQPSADGPSDFYLCAGQITPYKKLDVAIEAFNKNGKRLIIAGNGASAAMKSTAQSNIEFIENVDDETLSNLLRNCRALIFPGLEDFGILPVEVMASGRPVIAFGRGGAVETVVDGVTGILFSEQTSESLQLAVEKFESIEAQFDPIVIRDWAKKFELSKFKIQFKSLVDTLQLSQREQRSIFADPTPSDIFELQK
jgi:glycosyltransferase involved in cell wall biosynthesis